MGQLKMPIIKLGYLLGIFCGDSMPASFLPDGQPMWHLISLSTFKSLQLLPSSFTHL
jgi:hypothetical protein